MNKSDYKYIISYTKIDSKTQRVEKGENPRKIEAIASWKSCQSPPWSLESASKGPISLSPKLGSSSWLPILVLLCARVRVFGVGVEVDKKKYRKNQKNAFYAVSACSGASGAGQAPAL